MKTEFTAEFSIVASGDVADYTPSKVASIAEVFAMAKMFQDDVKDAFIRSLARARDRIKRGVKGGFHGLTKKQEEERDAIIKADREEAAREAAVQKGCRHASQTTSRGASFASC